MHGTHQKMENETIRIINTRQSRVRENKIKKNNIKQNIRGQITIFIIIILVVGMVFMVLTYLSRTTIEQQQEVETVRKAETRDVITSVQAHVQSCLDQAAKEGLLLLGKQGGYIFKGQGGVVDPATIKPTNNFLFSQTLSCTGKLDEISAHNGKCGIPYVIRPRGQASDEELGEIDYGRLGNTRIVHSGLPGYPFEGFPEVTIIESGVTTNLLNFTAKTGRGSLLALNETIPPKPSMQYILEQYITDRTLTCVDWSTYQEQGLNITAGSASTNVSFDSKSTSYIMNYNVTVKDSSNSTENSYAIFSGQQPVRLGWIHAKISSAIDKEVEELRYKFEEAATDTMTVSTDIVVGDLEEEKPLDTIITFHDKESTIDGSPYKFYIATQNRPPALWKLDSTTITSSTTDSTLTSMKDCGIPKIDGISVTKSSDFHLCGLTRDPPTLRGSGMINPANNEPYTDDQKRDFVDSDKVKMYIDSNTHIFTIENPQPYCNTQKKFEMKLCALDPDDNEVGFTLTSEELSEPIPLPTIFPPTLGISSTTPYLVGGTPTFFNSMRTDPGQTANTFTVTIYTYDKRDTNIDSKHMDFQKLIFSGSSDHPTR